MRIVCNRDDVIWDIGALECVMASGFHRGSYSVVCPKRAPSAPADDDDDGDVRKVVAVVLDLSEHWHVEQAANHKCVKWTLQLLFRQSFTD